MILYFSGTGNSRYAAEYLAKLTEDETVDIGNLLKAHDKGGNFTSEKPFVFVCPVYSWRIPRVFETFLSASTFHGSRDAYFVITCGGDIGNAEAHLLSLCRKKDFHLKGAAEVVMPENYIAMFTAPKKEEAEQILEAAVPVLSETARRIKNRAHPPEKKISIIDRLKSGIVNTCFYTFCVKAKGFRITESCTGCGTCQRLCPLDNIRMKEGRPVWGKNCTHCMACICRCPEEAIEYKNVSCGKVRYYNDRKI